MQAARAEAEERGLLIELRLSGGSALLAPLLLHESAVRQAVDNLLSNALKFAPRSSTILVTAEVLSSDDSAERGRRVRISVRDFGPGVPAAQRQTIFAPFRRAGAGAGAAGVAVACGPVAVPPGGVLPQAASVARPRPSKERKKTDRRVCRAVNFMWWSV